MSQEVVCCCHVPGLQPDGTFLVHRCLTSALDLGHCEKRCEGCEAE